MKEFQDKGCTGRKIHSHSFTLHKNITVIIIIKNTQESFYGSINTRLGRLHNPIRMYNNEPIKCTLSLLDAGLAHHSSNEMHLNLNILFRYEQVQREFLIDWEVAKSKSKCS